ncbi:hypothetical protein GCM10009864_59880 [Streptomyces lunalinharesii]|uniref:Uncharacterized protein n=1 Tax=Streptomyces lunalinharesii TaxID=333384 RepID=A0ABN3SKQ6_9ACTN
MPGAAAGRRPNHCAVVDGLLAEVHRLVPLTCTVVLGEEGLAELAAATALRRPAALSDGQGPVMLAALALRRTGWPAAVGSRPRAPLVPRSPSSGRWGRWGVGPGVSGVAGLGRLRLPVLRLLAAAGRCRVLVGGVRPAGAGGRSSVAVLSLGR